MPPVLQLSDFVIVLVSLPSVRVISSLTILMTSSISPHLLESASIALSPGATNAHEILCAVVVPFGQDMAVRHPVSRIAVAIAVNNKEFLSDSIKAVFIS